MIKMSETQIFGANIDIRLKKVAVSSSHFLL